MSDDMVKRLRAAEADERCNDTLCYEAADHIESLTAALASERENADRLAAALLGAERALPKDLRTFRRTRGYASAALAAHAKHRQQED